MGTLHAMRVDAGDLRLSWSKKRPVEIEVARDAFERLVKKEKYIAFKMTEDGLPGRKILEFDPEAEKIILQPQMSGG